MPPGYIAGVYASLPMFGDYGRSGLMGDDDDNEDGDEDDDDHDKDDDDDVVQCGPGKSIGKVEKEGTKQYFMENVSSSLSSS